MRESGREPRRPPPEPRRFPIPNFRCSALQIIDMWTQWGAQARAAEYNAAKNAAARRTSEEHKLPQKPVPVSLSAFTKNAPVNRNKGTKVWKPLVLDTTPEAENDGAENNDDIPSTPTRLKSTDSNSRSEGIDMSLAQVMLPRFSESDSTPSSTAPTALKAMLKLSQTPSSLINPSPKRVQPHSIIKQNPPAVTPSVHNSPGDVTGIGRYPNPTPRQYPRITWYYDLQGFPVIVPMKMPTAEPVVTQYSGNIMAPDDLSPTKQENKLASLSHKFTGPLPNFLPQYGHYIPASSNFANPVVPRMPELQLDGQQHANYQGTMLLANPVPRPPLQHVNTDSIVEVDGSHSDTSSFSVPTIVRHYSYPIAAAATPGQPSTTDQAIQTAGPQRADVPVVQSCEKELYDRKTKMQTFVAAQQALAKTGKTVLHNPDLHRVRKSETASPARSGITVATPERGDRGQILTPGSITVLKPPPGFGLLPIARQLRSEAGAKQPSPINQASLRQIFDIDSEDWLELKPVTESERKKMNMVMSTFARSQAPDQPQGLAHKTINDRKENLKRWMQAANKDTKPVTATRKLFEDAARERLSSGATGVGNGIVTSDYLSREDLECAAICAVGEILGNLMDDQGATGAGTDSPGSFGKYKPAPEYAIERGRLLMGNTGSTSFFEDNTGGFYNAPSRIARDPRFRPAGKEAIQVKPDESWKLRGDMYGRRRM